jgi:hypothetical protein
MFGIFLKPKILLLSLLNFQNYESKIIQLQGVYVYIQISTNMRRPRLPRRGFAISLVALCSQSWSVAKRITSTAENHFDTLGARSGTASALTAIKI